GLGGGTRPVVKSVHAPLAAEWVVGPADVDVVVVLRHPANVLASWLSLDLPDGDRHLDDDGAVRRLYTERWGVAPPGPDRLERAVWHVGLFTAALEEAASHHPEWTVCVHEDLCVDPPSRFAALFDAVGLRWTPSSEAALAAGDRPGDGFSLQRRAADAAGAWRGRLGRPELDALRRVLAAFPLRNWAADDLPGDMCAG
ncbi:MAG: hypothetical protein ACRDY1_07915, partial [Acidimicrobiales bacterium]